MEESRVKIFLEPRKEFVTTEGVLEELEAKAEEIGQVIGEFCAKLLGKVKDSAGTMAPESLTIEFGLSGEGKKNFIIVEGSVKGHFKVSATWKKS